MNIQLSPSEHAKHAVRSFISENLFLSADAPLGDDSSLLDSGALDSTAAMELVEFLESTFSISIDSSEIILDNLDTINRIVALIERKKAALVSEEQ